MGLSFLEIFLSQNKLLLTVLAILLLSTQRCVSQSEVLFSANITKVGSLQEEKKNPKNLMTLPL